MPPRGHTMRRCLALFSLLSCTTSLWASGLRPFREDRVNATLSGRVLAFTRRLGDDRRVPSAILGRPRDLYVYLPPGHDPSRPYPMLVWLHGGFGDEGVFVRGDHLERLERLFAEGRCPPFVIA